MKRTAITKRRRARFGFIVETVAELRKVTWPTRQEAVRLTLMVVTVVLVLGLLLSAIDYGFTQLSRILFR